jgi:hypothetical protein
MEGEIKKLTLKGFIDTCPDCGYTDGFHMAFKDHLDKLKIILICPDCHARFDPTWIMPRTAIQGI